MKILFCNIAWMKYYQGADEDDQPKNGGKYIEENSNGEEVFNFLSVNGKCYGFVMTYGNLNLEKHYSEISLHEAQSDGFTIVWCAKNDKGGTKIIGWYRNATVFREEQFIQSFTDESFNLYFNFVADAQNCYLLPEDKRSFKIERASVAGKGNGFGQSNVWYAESAYAQNELIPEVIQYIDNYEGEIILPTFDDELLNAVITNEQEKNDYQLLMDKGIELLNNELFVEALPYFNTARILQENPEVLYYIGYIHFVCRCYNEAIILFEKCLEQDYETMNTIDKLISCYDLTANREKTLEYCKKILNLLENPRNIEEMNDKIFYSQVMCDIYSNQSEFEKALKIANQILSYTDDEEILDIMKDFIEYLKEAQNN